MVEVTLSWTYTATARYDTDLDDRIRAAIDAAVTPLGGAIVGEAGGAWVGPGPDALAADCMMWFTVPDLNAAGPILQTVNVLLQAADARFVAHLDVAAATLP